MFFSHFLFDIIIWPCEHLKEVRLACYVQYKYCLFKFSRRICLVWSCKRNVKVTARDSFVRSCIMRCPIKPWPSGVLQCVINCRCGFKIVEPSGRSERRPAMSFAQMARWCPRMAYRRLALRLTPSPLRPPFSPWLAAPQQDKKQLAGLPSPFPILPLTILVRQ